jgi:hypothetical protein
MKTIAPLIFGCLAAVKRTHGNLFAHHGRLVRQAAVIFGLTIAAAAKAGTFDVETKLTASHAAAGDQFGSSVAISGNTAIVGAYGDADDGNDSGSACLFTPEPSSVLLVGLAFLALLARRKDRGK